MERARFYDESYAATSLSAWRELSARGKADHVAELCARAGLAPRRIVEIGCGDGALLGELAARGVGERLSGFDISVAAIDLARERGITCIEALESFDGRHLPARDDAFDLAVLSHVLEHVDDPVALLREAARCAEWLVVEVPLEANASARRASKRAGAERIGHVQSLSRPSVHALITSTGLEPAEYELLDPLPLAVHTHFARGAVATVRAVAKGATRRAVFRASPALAERLFTLHYACIARRDASGV